MQICKENFFSMGGEGTPLPESLKFLDILGKNLVIFDLPLLLFTPEFTLVSLDFNNFLLFQTELFATTQIRTERRILLYGFSSAECRTPPLLILRRMMRIILSHISAVVQVMKMVRWQIRIFLNITSAQITKLVHEEGS